MSMTGDTTGDTTGDATGSETGDVRDPTLPNGTSDIGGVPETAPVSRQNQATPAPTQPSAAAYAAQRGPAAYTPLANPDDPMVRRPRQGTHGPLPGPDDTGAPGRMAIVQGQVFLVAVIVLVQLWLVTSALLEVLSGRPNDLDAMTLASGIGVLLALLLWQWPRRRVLGG